jgi:hypothetical protein
MGQSYMYDELFYVFNLPLLSKYFAENPAEMCSFYGKLYSKLFEMTDCIVPVL